MAVTACAFNGASFSAFLSLCERFHCLSRHLNRDLPAGDRKLVMKRRIGEKEFAEKRTERFLHNAVRQRYNSHPP